MNTAHAFGPMIKSGTMWSFAKTHRTLRMCRSTAFPRCLGETSTQLFAVVSKFWWHLRDVIGSEWPPALLVMGPLVLALKFERERALNCGPVFAPTVVEPPPFGCTVPSADDASRVMRSPSRCQQDVAPLSKMKCCPAEKFVSKRKRKLTASSFVLIFLP